MPSPRRLIVSFHDLHPGSRETCARFLAELRELGVARATLLVVPRWHGAPACAEDHAFAAWLRECAAAGHEICLHGFRHRADAVTGNAVQRAMGRHYTAGEGEFYQIDEPTAAARLREGGAMLTDAIGVPVWGFTAPAWLLSDGGRAALRAAGFHYSTAWGRVELLQTGAHVAAPTLVWSVRAAWRRACSRAWVRLWGARNRRAPVLRIAVHPVDFQHASIARSVRAAIARHAVGREATCYRELLPPEAAPVRFSPVNPRAPAVAPTGD